MKSLLVIAALGGTLGVAEAALAQAMDTSANRVIVKTAAPAANAAAPAPSNAGVLQLMREIDSLKREVQALRGQVENQSYELEQLRRQQTSAYTDLDRRLQAGQTAAGGVAPLPTLTPASPGAVAGTPAPESALQVETEANGAVVATDPLAPPAGAAPPTPPALPADPMAATMPPPAPAGGVAPVPGAMPPPAPPAMPPAVAPPGVGEVAPPAPPVAPPAPTADDATSEAAYRDAFALLRAGDYDKAIAAFTAFQADHPGSQYGDNAQYWLAEAYYAKGQYAPAIAEYQKMLTQYPGSKKLSHAMLKTGYSYDKLGKPAEASATLKSLIEQYPGSSAARLAEERLAQIKAGKPR